MLFDVEDFQVIALAKSPTTGCPIDGTLCLNVVGVAGCNCISVNMQVIGGTLGNWSGVADLGLACGGVLNMTMTVNLSCAGGIWNATINLSNGADLCAGSNTFPVGPSGSVLMNCAGHPGFPCTPGSITINFLQCPSSTPSF